MAQPPPEPIALPSPPNDGITSLAYLPLSPAPSGAADHGPPPSLLASTSWDGALRLHDAAARTHLVTQTMDAGPLLSLSVGSSGDDGSSGGGSAVVGTVCAGGIDGSVKRFDAASSSVELIGRHSADADRNDLLSGKRKVAVSCLASLDGGLVASAGWDRRFHVWDVRAGNKKAAASCDLPGKAFGMDASRDGKRVVVATSGRRNCFFDVRKPDQPVETTKEGEGGDETGCAKLLLDRESSLKYQTRCVRFFPDARGIAVGSIEGRVAIEYLDDIGVVSGKKKYAFKCHRINDTVYPVNDVAFHPVHGTFATGGADGTVVTWDGSNKKKLSSIAKCPTSVACLAFAPDGKQIAIASSYTYEEGERDHPREEIYVRDVLDNEVRPKAKK